MIIGKVPKNKNIFENDGSINDFLQKLETSLAMSTTSSNNRVATNKKRTPDPTARGADTVKSVKQEVVSEQEEEEVKLVSKRQQQEKKRAKTLILDDDSFRSNATSF